MKKLLLFTLFTALSLGCWAQKRPLEWSDIQAWNKISSKAISGDGKYITVAVKPAVGDGYLSLYASEGEELKRVERGESPKILDQNIVVATIAPEKALVDSLKLAKKKKLPKNQLLIYNIAKGEEMIIDSLNDMKTAKKCGEWLAYRTGSSNALTLTNFDGVSAEFDNVDEYKFAEDLGCVIFNQFKKDKISQISIFDLSKGEIVSQIEIEDGVKGERFAMNEAGDIAYITVGKDKSGSENQLLLWSAATSETKQIEIDGLAADWIINENYAPHFAEGCRRLFFGVSPQYPVADTTILESDKAKVDIWIWNEPKLKSVQVVDYKQDIKKSYRAVYDMESAKVSQIASLEFPTSQLLLSSGDSDLALVSTTEPYGVETMWTAEHRCDVYLKNILTGEQREVFKGENTYVRISPEANYLYWYIPVDSAWYAYSVADRALLQLTTPDVVAAYDCSRDVPTIPSAYSEAGWSEGDKLLYIYDRHDIWALDPTGKKSPERLTNGAESDITYRIVALDSEKESFEKSEKLLLQTFNNSNKQSGFASMSINKPSSLKSLIAGDYSYGTPVKATKSNTMILTRENFHEFPNIYVADIDFKRTERALTDVNPQQSEFIWGDVEAITWVSLDGDTLRGNLYKPENFDPSKRYPMICNFYELSSDEIFNHKTPTIHRSTIDYHYYTSNGYVIFNPDIRYIDGYPGESCYNCLMPGITKILEMGFVDPARIGAQGHSWGGYQTAYLATRTSLFAAIESGAPVVNMISAYGGIRWATGRNRSMQYERGQSRIGASPWEAPSKYTENSPIYFMDKVTTPILIMHNDNDGHVPWWQGIEFFIALRRLEKPAWMLNYNGEPHWPTTMPNMLDFQTRMGQFFDHYLKGCDMPEWME